MFLHEFVGKQRQI